jgi:hypothetical protein
MPLHRPNRARGRASRDTYYGSGAALSTWACLTAGTFDVCVGATTGAYGGGEVIGSPSSSTRCTRVKCSSSPRGFAEAAVIVVSSSRPFFFVARDVR